MYLNDHISDGVLEWITTIINYTLNGGHEELKSILADF